MKKNILFIINTLGRAGAERALIELLKKIDENPDLDMDLYAIIPRGELFSEVPKSINILNPKWDDGSVHSPGGRGAIALEVMKSFFYKLTGFRLLPYMVQNAKEQKKRGSLQWDKLFWRPLAEGKPFNSKEYDLAVAFIEGGAAYYLDKRVRAKKKAAFIHIDYERAGYLPMMDRDCYGRFDRIFVVSEETGRKFSAAYPHLKDRIYLFRNILDREGIIKKAETGTGFDDDYKGIRLVTVGRLSYQKGYDIAARAFKKLREKGYDVRWYIVGEGPERGSLEKLIGELGISGEFILLGAKDNPYPYINGADIYVHATRFEGKSIAIEEAQVLGKPILASLCTGTVEQIESGTDGLLIDLDEDNLSEKLAWLIDNPDIQRTYAANTKKKELLYPGDLNNLISLLDDEGGGEIP